MKNIILLITVLVVFTGCTNGYQRGYERGMSEGKLVGIGVCQDKVEAIGKRIDRMIEYHKE